MERALLRAYCGVVLIDDDARSRILLPDGPADQRAILDAGGVACWSEPVLIDTYEPGEPDRYPLFLDRRVFQGSSGRVYPLPMIDAVAHEKTPRLWQAIHLENAAVRLMLLPELGGRIHIGYDKAAGYDFFYRNNVIKPALVGLLGPWISGGVEFNWPQHHRPATFLPVDSRIEREPDGGVVVWHSDLDPLQRMRAVHGIRLRPGSALIEADVTLHNRTDTAQTFLWWANVAARAHERYQCFFPDDVAYVADHARRAITAFPRADRPYYGVDYAQLATERPDADRIDVYSNIPVPTSYMVTDTADAFFGGYDHEADAGFVHWADPAISPGKKQWTWGDGPIGRAWDAQLTDTDGPYVELMAGVYTDNQPDFAWLVPGETKRFSQFWYPIHGTGPVRQATTEAALAVTADGDGTRIAVIGTATHDDVVIAALRDGVEVARFSGPLGTADPLVHRVADDVDHVTVHAGRRELVAWRRHTDPQPEPWVATAPPQPNEIDGVDELYLTAVHLEQYRHPSRSAVPYLTEILGRDPHDTRAATALAAHHLRRGRYAEARELLDRAVTQLTRRNFNPRDGEALYLRGLVAERQGDHAQADRDFARAAWNAVWAPAATVARARLALRDGRPDAALDLAHGAAELPEARRIAVLALRRLGRSDAAAAMLAELYAADPLDPALRALIAAVGTGAAAPAVTGAAAPAVTGATAPAVTGATAPAVTGMAVPAVTGTAAPAVTGAGVTVEPVTADARTLLDVAAELARAGAYADALAVTVDDRVPASPAGFGNAEPMRLLLRAQWADAAGDHALASRERARAAASDLDRAFPAGLDHLDALSAAIDADPDHLAARALRGTWLLDAGRHGDAIGDLRVAVEGGLENPVAWRNFGLATVHSGGDATADAADAAYQRALAISRDPRLVFERDVLAQVRGLDAVARLALLRQHPDTLDLRDDLALTHVGLLLDTAEVDAAWEILTHRVFRPFEGGEGRVIAAYDRAACALARRLLADGRADEARELMRAGVAAPGNLGEGRHPAEPLAERYVLWGDACARLGEYDAARAAWTTACSSSPLAVAPRAADEADYWIGVARLRLGESGEESWARLETRAAELDAARDEVDYFATSLPELLVFDIDTVARRSAAANRLRALAAAGRSLAQPPHGKVEA